MANPNPFRIGTSGYIYRHWRGAFYPEDMPTRRWFAFYAHHFDTVEINNSFYRLPSPENFREWRRQAPPDFLYAVKASRFLTHMKKLKDPAEPLEGTSWAGLPCSARRWARSCISCRRTGVATCRGSASLSRPSPGT